MRKNCDLLQLLFYFWFVPSTKMNKKFRKSQRDGETTESVFLAVRTRLQCSNMKHAEIRFFSSSPRSARWLGSCSLHFNFKFKRSAETRSHASGNTGKSMKTKWLLFGRKLELCLKCMYLALVCCMQSFLAAAFCLARGDEKRLKSRLEYP